MADGWFFMRGTVERKGFRGGPSIKVVGLGDCILEKRRSVFGVGG